MEVTYTTTMDDYVAFNRYLSKRSPQTQTVILVGAFTVAVILILVGAVVALALATWWIVLVGVAAALLAAAVYGPLFWPYFDRLVRAYAEERDRYGMLGLTTLILSEDGIVEITEVARSEARWANMHGIFVDGDRTYIMVTGMSCALLPRHGFNDPHEYDAATDFAIEQATRAGKPVS
jgi:type IV secretory pathway TrbD component